MNKKTLIAALVQTANELDVLGMEAEANAVTRIAINITNGKRLAAIPGPDTNSVIDSWRKDDGWEDGDNTHPDYDDLDEQSMNPLYGSGDALSGAFTAQQATSDFGVGDMGGDRNNTQKRMSEIVSQIQALSTEVERMRSTSTEEENFWRKNRRRHPNHEQRMEQVNEAEEMIAELESELHDLSSEAHRENMDESFQETDDNDPYGEMDMGSEPIFHGKKRVPYDDELAGGKGARLFN